MAGLLFALMCAAETVLLSDAPLVDYFTRGILAARA